MTVLPLSETLEPVRSTADRSKSAVEARLAQSLDDRILLHLYRLPQMTPGQTFRVEFCQEGISQALQVQQGRISDRLKRLVNDGWVTALGRQHVHGKISRLFVYSLTSQGRARALELSRNLPSGAESRPGAMQTQTIRPIDGMREKGGVESRRTA